MLSALAIKNFLIIDQVEVYFDRGLTAWTGETGTGKSILIDALQLALGRRAQSHLVRPGADRLSVSISLDLHQQAAAQRWLAAQHMENREHSCVIRRSVNRDGRSQAFINGALSTLEQLRAFTTHLVDVVGQNNQQQLLNRARHLDLLDLYSDHAAQLAEMQAVYKQWQTVAAQLALIKQQSQEIDLKRQWLRQQCEELENAAVQAGEFERIEQQHRRLSQKEKLKEVLATAHNALDAESEQNALQLLGVAYAELKSLQEIDTDLQAVAALISRAREQSSEATHEIRRYLEQLENAPSDFDDLEKRLSVLSELARKYRTQPSQLADKLAQARAELKRLDDPERSIEQLAQKKAALAAAYQQVARAVSRKRRQSAQILEQEVLKLLAQLNMPQAQFKIAFDTSDDATPSPSGLERAEFMLCANPGQKLQTLAKAASGGERSRVSLALQVALSNQRMTPVLVFDEVDSGVGGATAEIIGRLLKKLSAQAQVFCITHLAQIASQADHHYYVDKRAEDKSTFVSLAKLDGEARLQELARMIAGTKISPQSLDYARQLLAAPAQ